MILNLLCFFLAWIGPTWIGPAWIGPTWIGPGAFNSEADGLLKKYVQNGEVNYQALAERPEPLNQLYQLLNNVSLTGEDEQERKAFYINAYNIITIYQIVENYPVSSPMEISGFFDNIRHTVAGENLTLNQLEKERLFVHHFDPRLHFVLVCAAKSCPALADFAYTADKLDQQLEEKTRAALNNPDFIQVRPKDEVVMLSKIFEWYEKDFLQEAPSLLAYINQYRNQPLPSDLKIKFYEYNWQLNQLSRN